MYDAIHWKRGVPDAVEKLIIIQHDKEITSIISELPDGNPVHICLLGYCLMAYALSQHCTIM